MAEHPGKFDRASQKKQQSELPLVVFLSLRQKGQYFVRFRDGECHAGGLTTEDREFLGAVQGTVREVQFGSEGMIVRYSPNSSSD